MNKNPENKDQADNDLNEYLAGESEISQLYRSTQDQEPSASLDALILNKAKAAVKKTSQAATEEPKAGFFTNLLNAWLVPTVSLASFAVVAVVVTVLISNPGTGTEGDENNIARTQKPNNGTQPVSNTNKGKNVGAEGLQTSPHMINKADALIKKIKALHAKGDLAGAKKSFKLFQKKYPGYPHDKLKQALQKTGLLKQ